MSHNEATLIHEKVQELEPEIFAFDLRFRRKLEMVRSLIGTPSGSPERSDFDAREIAKIQEEFCSVEDFPNATPACKAVAELVLAEKLNFEDLLALHTDHRCARVAQLAKGIRNKRLRPSVQRLLNLTPIEYSMGLPKLIGQPKWIVHARLNRAVVVELLDFSDGDEDLQLRTKDVLASPFVETWTFGAGFVDFKSPRPGTITEAESNRETLERKLVRLERFTLKGIEEFEATWKLPSLSGSAPFAFYARCKVVSYLRRHPAHREILCRASTVQGALNLVSQLS